MTRNGWDSRAYGPWKWKRFFLVMIATQTVKPLLTTPPAWTFSLRLRCSWGHGFVDVMEGECCGKAWRCDPWIYRQWPSSFVQLLALFKSY